MNDELSFAKVTAPYSTGTVRRRRLFARLDAAPPAIFISAPPGAGKTTLANSYLADAGRPPLWYDIDPSDADPASFFFHLRAAVPSPPEDLPLLTAERMGGPESFAREFFRRLFALNAPFDLVLDNCHELPEDAELFRLLRYAFPELHASRRLFLLSRNAIPGPLARYQLDGSLERLDGDDLRLDNDEVIAITRLVSSPSKKPEETDRLAERSGGWAAGLMLLLSREASAMEGADRRNELLFDYFTSEVFQGLAGAEQRFLLRAAYLPWFTPETAKRLTNEPASEAIIHTLARRNAFLEKRTAANQTVYRFHPLF
ncbi:MAG TPA: hypothetical protein VKA64_05655, partial [Gammaproteobacteria bacterium]|nr:hypothetical protein [Gammaproteobacteria bacterium]